MTSLASLPPSAPIKDPGKAMSVRSRSKEVLHKNRCSSEGSQGCPQTSGKAFLAVGMQVSFGRRLEVAWLFSSAQPVNACVQYLNLIFPLHLKYRRGRLPLATEGPLLTILQQTYSTNESSEEKLGSFLCHFDWPKAGGRKA